MVAIITKEGVAKAIETLREAGKKISPTGIYAFFGNRGSFSTIAKYKAEIDSAELEKRDSEEGLRAFRQMWSLAIQEGRKQAEEKMLEMQETLDAVVAQSEQLDGQFAAANGRVADLEKQRDSMVAELAKSNEQVTTARATGEQNANKAAEVLTRMSTMQETHAHELADLRQQLGAAQNDAHAVELKLARAEARLEK